MHALHIATGAGVALRPHMHPHLQYRADAVRRHPSSTTSGDAAPRIASPSDRWRLNATPPALEAAGGATAPPPDVYSNLVSGKAFTCTSCGKCCTGSGEVWMNEAEYTATARHLGMDTKRFLIQYAKAYSKRPGWRLLRRKHRSADCIFLKADNTCGIYGARPLQCSTYPWWPELMGDRAWAAEAQVVCEGIGHADAPELDVPAAAAALRAQTEHEAKHSESVLTSRTGGTWSL